MIYDPNADSQAQNRESSVQRKGHRATYLPVNKVANSGLAEKLVCKSNGVTPTPSHVGAVMHRAVAPGGCPKTETGRVRRNACLRHARYAYQWLRSTFEPIEGYLWKDLKAQYITPFLVKKADVWSEFVESSENGEAEIASITTGENQLNIKFSSEDQGSKKKDMAKAISESYGSELDQLMSLYLEAEATFVEEISQLPYVDRLRAASMGHRKRNAFIRLVLKTRNRR